MKTCRAYKYRIYPTKAQQTNLLNQFSMCRHLYNWSIAERKQAFDEEKTYISYNEQQNKLPEMKKERTWYKGVYSLVLQDVLHRVDKTYKNFYRYAKKNGVHFKKKEKIEGYPKFKKKGQWTSIHYPQYKNKPNNFIKVPKVGIIKVVYHREVPEEANIKTLSISKEGGKWFACFTAEIDISVPVLKQDLQPLGIDLGINDFVYASNGYRVSPPKWYKEKKKHLGKLQRKFSSENELNKYSKKWYKLLYAIQKTHYKIRCQRDDFLHKEANKLLSSTNTVIYEKLQIKKMVARPKKIKVDDGSFLPNGAKYKAKLNQSINNMGWYKFIEILQYKADTQGKKIIGVPPQYTSQKCSSCGAIVKKSLAVRTHKCSECGFTANRDYNASLNILSLGLKTLALA